MHGSVIGLRLVVSEALLYTILTVVDELYTLLV